MRKVMNPVIFTIAGVLVSVSPFPFPGLHAAGQDVYGPLVIVAQATERFDESAFRAGRHMGYGDFVHFKVFFPSVGTDDAAMHPSFFEGYLHGYELAKRRHGERGGDANGDAEGPQNNN